MSPDLKSFSGILVVGSILILFFSACNQTNLPSPSSAIASPASESPTSEGTTSSSTPKPDQKTSTPTQLQPSPTSQPLAALINGDEITLAEYQSELIRYQLSVAHDLTQEDEKYVLDDMIDQVLLAQAASHAGFQVDEALIQERIGRIVYNLGGQDKFNEWMAKNNYVDESFRQVLTRSIKTAWMRDQITGGVPITGEHIHLRQILLLSAEEANEVLSLLDEGRDFTNLAFEYDPLGGGDLGWIAHGYLLDSNLEEVAFKLQPGEYSEVVETLAGFHILQVIEYDQNRNLEPEALRIHQTKALQEWIENQRKQTEIKILFP